MSAILPTVREAYELIAPELPTIQARILWLLERHPEGLTGLDLEPVMGYSGERRLSELREQGKVSVRYDGGVLITRPGRNGARQAVHFLGGTPIEKVRCVTCGSKVPAERVNGKQLSFA